MLGGRAVPVERQTACQASLILRILIPDCNRVSLKAYLETACTLQLSVQLDFFMEELNLPESEVR